MSSQEMGFPLTQDSHQRAGKMGHLEWASLLQMLFSDCFTWSIFSNLCCVHMHFLFQVYFYLQLRIKEVTHVLTAGKWWHRNPKVGLALKLLFFLMYLPKLECWGKMEIKIQTPFTSAAYLYGHFRLFVNWKLLCSRHHLRRLFLCQPLNLQNCSLSPFFFPLPIHPAQPVPAALHLSQGTLVASLPQNSHWPHCLTF